MTYFDVFNGDADGICALQQLRSYRSIDSVLITGVKRDIQLVRQVTASENDNVTVLDVSLDKNKNDIELLLRKYVKVTYFDHHYPGDIPAHPYFTCYIDTKPDTCTSLIVNQYLKGKYFLWAIVGAFGDNLDRSAEKVAKQQALNHKEILLLKELGILINYNGYGLSEDELHIRPDALFRELHPFENPIDFIEQSDTYRKLRDGYCDDMSKAETQLPEYQTDKCAVYVLPPEKWANRVSGVFINNLASQNPGRAHAILTKMDRDGYRVSVRAPLTTLDGADQLCRQFETGGGRKAAAGINLLPETKYEYFLQRFTDSFN
jgi:hypothetical protein